MNYRLHFIMNKQSGDDLEKLRNLPWEDGVVACVRHTWVWGLYHQMNLRGLPVSMGYALEPVAINAVHGEVARQLITPADLRSHYIIGIRADFRPFPYGRFEIVQNRHTAGGRKIYMPHMSQAGLIGRSPDRDKVVNISFAGLVRNLIDTERMEKELAAMDCRFVIKGEGQWHDMSDVDILLGIRSLSKKPYHDKPGTKLVNAWLAGIPFVGGYDSAYEQIGEPGKNYLRVNSYDGLMQAIRSLRDDKDLYRRLVNEGREAAHPYTPEKIVDRWVDFLREVVAPDYQAWKAGNLKVRLRAAAQGGLYFARERFVRAAAVRVRQAIGQNG